MKSLLRDVCERLIASRSAACLRLLVSLAFGLGCLPGQSQTTGMQSQIPSAEYNALVDLYNATSGDLWATNNGWPQPFAPTWAGVVVSGGHVTALNLSAAFAASGVGGSLPDSLGNLAQLQKLDLSSNLLSGTLPFALNQLRALTNLDLSHNEFSGDIPDFGGFAHGLGFNVSYNDFDVDPGTDSSVNIEAMLLAGVNVVSTPQNPPGMQSQIPAAEYNALVDLYENAGGSFWINSTGWLDGTARYWSGVMVSTGHVAQLLVGSFYAGVGASGTIPGSLGNLAQLQDLDISNNRLSGGIPFDLNSLRVLTNLNLAHNDLDGEAPDFSGFPRGAHLDISYNNLDVGPGTDSSANILAMTLAGLTVVSTPQNPAAGALGQLRILSNGGIVIGFTGTTGQTYSVQVSTDLTNWSPFASIVIPVEPGEQTGQAQITDVFLPNALTHFYRAVWPP